MARTSKRLLETFETPVYFVQYKKTNKMGILPIQFMERRATYPSPQLDPTNHDYAQNEDGFLYPFLAIEQPIPSDFPHPCTCLKCARETVCVEFKNLNAVDSVNVATSAVIHICD